MTQGAGRAPSVVVVGGGLSGLVAALQLQLDLPGAHVTVVEAADAPGGKLETHDFPSGPVELGAEAFIGRRPEAADLVAELGMTQDLRHPSRLAPAVLTGGVLHPMPAGTVMGLPGEAGALAGVLSDDEVRRAAAEPELPWRWTPGSDTSVGELVGERFGRAVVDRLVDPMLGGVYAAPSAGLSLREVVPGLADVLDAGAGSLTGAVRTILSRRVPGPVFAAFAGGYRTFVDSLVESSEATLLTRTRCTSVRRRVPDPADPGAPHAYEVDVVGPDGPAVLAADELVLAVPVPDAVALLRPVAPEQAAALSTVRTSSSAVVGLEIDRDAVLPAHSGVLVATDEPVPFKAMTFTSSKWPHLDTRRGHVVRVSFGRLGSESVLDHSDAELTALATAGLRDVCRSAPAVLHSRVRRWDDGLPEIAPGHAAHLAAIREGLRRELPGVELVGAVTEGVGVPACIGSARAAARRLAARWQD